MWVRCAWFWMRSGSGSGSGTYRFRICLRSYKKNKNKTVSSGSNSGWRHWCRQHSLTTKSVVHNSTRWCHISVKVLNSLSIYKTQALIKKCPSESGIFQDKLQNKTWKKKCPSSFTLTFSPHLLPASTCLTSIIGCPSREAVARPCCSNLPRPLLAATNPARRWPRR